MMGLEHALPRCGLWRWAGGLGGSLGPDVQHQADPLLLRCRRRGEGAGQGGPHTAKQPAGDSPPATHPGAALQGAVEVGCGDGGRPRVPRGLRMGRERREDVKQR